MLAPAKTLYHLPVAVLIVAASRSLAPAHGVKTTKLTWTADISRMVNKRCAPCHGDGGKAPMSLLTYEESHPSAKAIRDEVLARRMQPWGGRGSGDFLQNPSLTSAELFMLAAWVEGGAPGRRLEILTQKNDRHSRGGFAHPSWFSEDSGEELDVLTSDVRFDRHSTIGSYAGAAYLPDKTSRGVDLAPKK